jgi:hypothetical protein
MIAGSGRDVILLTLAATLIPVPYYVLVVRRSPRHVLARASRASPWRSRDAKR